MRRIIAAKALVTAEGLLPYPRLIIEDGQITSIRSAAEGEAVDPDLTHDYPEAVVAPAYLDVHLHGGAGYDVMEGTPESLDVIRRFLTRHGVGAFLPTTVTTPEEDMLRALTSLARGIERATREPSPGAVPLGIHLEGPFLSHVRRGVHLEAQLRPPSITAFDRFWQAAEGRIVLMTIAPEIPGALELIAYATSLGVHCSVGHTDASFGEAKQAHIAGARSATHTFNAMRPLLHRDPGVIAFVLNEDAMFAEIIADGHHVDPEMVRLLYKAKGPDRTLLVTDGISASGMPDGHYKLGDLEVEVIDGKCTSNGVIAGSTLTLDRGVRNLMEFAGIPLDQAVRSASQTPAHLLGQELGWGTVRTGGPAHLVILSQLGEVLETFVHGVPQSQST